LIYLPIKNVWTSFTVKAYMPNEMVKG